MCQPRIAARFGILAATERPPDLLLLDYLLPDLNGDDVCRAISGNVALATVPVVVMSAKGEEAGACFSSLASVVDILPKPFSPDALLAVVHHALEKRQQPANPRVGRAARQPGRGRAVAQGQEEKPAGLPIGPDGAALLGDLAVVSIADVLLLLQDRQHSGTLRLQGQRREHRNLREQRPHRFRGRPRRGRRVPAGTFPGARWTDRTGQVG